MEVCLRREWLDSYKFGLQNSVPGFFGFDVETKAKLCFGQALYSDMNYTGAGTLPPNVHQMHLTELAGPFLLQTGKSKHYGFVEFEYPKVAKIVADCMHNYLLFEHMLQVCLVPLEHVHPKLQAFLTMYWKASHYLVEL